MKTTIALAIMSLIIGCGGDNVEHVTGEDIQAVGISVAVERERMRRTDDAGKLAAAQVDYGDALNQWHEIRAKAVAQGMDQDEVERWYRLGLGVDTDYILGER